MIIVLQLRLVTKENKANIPAMVAWYILLLPWNAGNNLLRKSKLKLIAPNNNTSQRYLNNTTQQLHWKNQLALLLHNKTNVTNCFLTILLPIVYELFWWNVCWLVFSRLYSEAEKKKKQAEMNDDLRK